MSYQVTPTIKYNADGSEYLSYDDAVVTDSSYKEEIHRQHVYEQESGDEDFVWDPESQTYRHRFADLDPELLDQHGEQYALNPEDYEVEETDGREFSDAERDHLFGMVGGSDNYSVLMEFAKENMPDDFIQQYDAIMQSGDMEQSQEAISVLLEAYQNWDGEAEEDVSEDMDELADAIYEQFGGQESYTSMLQWAATNKSQEFIDAYDAAMESGDYWDDVFYGSTSPI